MVNNVIRFSVQHRLTVLALTFLIGILGWLSFQKLPIDAVPDITNKQVQINAEVHGLSPEEIERGVTYLIENSMRGIPDVSQVRSITRFGLSQVTVVFKDDMDIYRARQLVSERLQNVASELPKNVRPEMGPISTGLGEIYQYVLDHENPATDPDERFKQLVELRTIQEWLIKPMLLNVSGVAEVNVTGGYEKQYHVKPNPQKLARYGLHFADIVSALENANSSVGGGYVEQTSDQFLVQAVGIFQNLTDIKKVPVKSLETFKTITIEDVAEVELGRELRTGAATYNGHEVVLGTVMMLMGENSRKISSLVHQKMSEIIRALPSGMKIKTVYNRSDLVNETLGTVEHNLMLGAFLVIVVLLLLVGNIRAAIITAITIPLSLLITFLAMKPLGISGNLMSLGALDFGIIVDGVVIVIDNCVRRLEEKTRELKHLLSAREMEEVIIQATVEIRKAAGFGQLIIVVVFLPLFGLTGIEGKMFQPMAATFVIALFSALLLSFTAAPALAGVLFTRPVADQEPKIMKVVRRFYVKWLEYFLTQKKKVILFFITSMVIGAITFMRLGGEFMPQLSEGSFAFHMIRPTNISLSKAIEYQFMADEIIKSFPEVEHVFSRIGTSEVATDPMGVNVADTYIMLKDRSKWSKFSFYKKKTYSELMGEMVERLEAELPGMRYLASQPIQMRFNELLEGTRADVTVKIVGADLERLVNLGDELKDLVSQVEGAGDVELDTAGKSPVLRVIPKTEVLNRYGVQKNEVLETVSIALGGQEAGYFYEGDRRYPIMVRISEDLRSDLNSIQSLPVGVSGNSTAPLSELAQIKFADTFSVINREDSKRRSAVMINLRGRDTESFVNEAQKLVQEKLKIPEGYWIHWGGNFKNLQEARSRLLFLTPIALLMVFMMIFAAFRSIRQTLLIFLCVPLAWVGGAVGLLGFGMPFSISAGVGFIALSGIAVLNGIVLVNYFNDIHQHRHLEGTSLIIEGASIRLRPVLMTALVDIFGFLPMVLSTGIGSEVQRPLAAVVIGGVMTSTVLTLIVLPVFYSIFETHSKEKV